MSGRKPVVDWTTDFDHLDAAWTSNPYPLWAELRAKCPVAQTQRFGGAYLPTRYDDIWRIALDAEHFSSRQIILRDQPLIKSFSAPPMTLDPPFHRPSRLPLLKLLTKGMADEWEPFTRNLCKQFLADIALRATCEATTDYTYPIPLRLLMAMMDLPAEDQHRFGQWARDIIITGVADAKVVACAMDEMDAYFTVQMRRRLAAPGKDLISQLIDAMVRRGTFPVYHVLITLRLIVLAGIDTTSSVIGSILWHLAQHDDERRRLASAPTLASTAVEELLRVFAPTTMAREVVKKTEVGGCTFEVGRTVLLPFPAANRDPDVFDKPDEINLDRKNNRHMAFGFGMHRCVGIHIARMVIRVATEEWLKQFSEFHLDAARPVEWSEGTVRGPRRLPLALGA